MHTSLAPHIREFIGSTLLSWLRDPDAVGQFGEITPRNIRDQILRMIPPEQAHAIGELHCRRVANALTRWIGAEDGYVQVRYLSDATAINRIARIIDESINDPKAGRDEDIVDDLSAVTYPRLIEWIEYVKYDMRAFVREQRRLGTRPRLAKQRMLQLAAGSIEDAMAEC